MSWAFVNQLPQTPTPDAITSEALTRPLAEEDIAAESRAEGHQSVEVDVCDRCGRDGVFYGIHDRCHRDRIRAQGRPARRAAEPAPATFVGTASWVDSPTEDILSHRGRVFVVGLSAPGCSMSAMTATPVLANGITINTNDQPLKRVAISGDTVADTFRGAADWLDAAARNLGEVVYVAGTHLEVLDGEDQPWQLSVFVYADELEASTQPTLAND